MQRAFHFLDPAFGPAGLPEGRGDAVGLAAGVVARAVRAPGVVDRRRSPGRAALRGRVSLRRLVLEAHGRPFGTGRPVDAVFDFMPLRAERDVLDAQYDEDDDHSHREPGSNPRQPACFRGPLDGIRASQRGFGRR